MQTGPVEVARQKKKCVLCGSTDLAMMGCFVPDEPKKWPADAGAFWYGLCAECSVIPDKDALVEAKLAAQLN